MDVYLRVSKVGGRDAKEEAYRSPALQRDACRRWAKQEQIAVGREVLDEDVSGGKAIGSRGLEELIARAERGATEGVIVYTLDRFERDEYDASVAIKRLRDAGARVVSATEGLDSSRTDPGSKMAFKMYLMM